MPSLKVARRDWCSYPSIQNSFTAAAWQIYTSMQRFAVFGDDEVPYPIDDKNQEVYNPISSLINQNYQEEAQDNDEFLRQHTLNRPEKISKELSIYCCAICGRNTILCNAKLEKLATRRTDGTIILDCKKYTVKHYLKADSHPLIITRKTGDDVICELKCQCEVPVAYICLNDLPNIKGVVDNTDTRGLVDKQKVLFVFSDAVVLDSKNALVFSELAGIKFLGPGDDRVN